MLETRLRDSNKEQDKVRLKLETMEDTSQEYQRIKREVATLRSKLAEVKVKHFFTSRKYGNWHERAAFQRSSFGRSRTGGRLLAMT